MIQHLNQNPLSYWPQRTATTECPRILRPQNAVILLLGQNKKLTIHIPVSKTTGSDSAAATAGAIANKNRTGATYAAAFLELCGFGASHGANPNVPQKINNVSPKATSVMYLQHPS
ncbi:MAG: hypothetical protein AB7G28_10580 [Pirellulales bacterium]